MVKVEGYVERIVYRNEDNGYTVMTVVEDNEEYTCVGIVQFINEGEYIEIEGEMNTHSSYGDQVNINSYVIKVPEDEIAIIRYLGSGAIKGIGPKMADRIVNKFKKNTFEIIENEPERLSEIKGISTRMAMEIASQLEEKRDMRKALIFLQQFGISLHLAIKIYNKYGLETFTVVKTNPYKLAEDIGGIGFKIADEIANKAGIDKNSDFRIKSCILYVLSQAAGGGHAFLPKEELVGYAKNMLEIEIDDIEKYLVDLVFDKKLVVKNKKDVYASSFYYTELSNAKMLIDLDIKEEIDEARILKRLEDIEKQERTELDKMQKDAIVASMKNGISIITGGPGTGKTTTINTLIKMFEREGLEILLAAPTGRAAKRMSEATGFTAQTIHRLLELNGSPDSGIMRFEKNEENPLETDVIIIDEMSMVDMFLMNALLKAVTVGTRLVLVGDVDQLPSVGAGNVLRDIIKSGKFNVVMLTKIFRQEDQSSIVINAHKINKGEQIVLDNKSKDFLFVRKQSAAEVIDATVKLVKEKLPEYVGCDKLEVQVLTPMRKGILGVENLNIVLQKSLNPPRPNKNEKEIGGGIFREGDKVMQIKNNYQLEWEIRGLHGIAVEKGMGVFNGDMGKIVVVNNYAEYLEVEFDDGKCVMYPFKQLDELELAYAATIHKSQGSEYPAIVFPALTGPAVLMNRNLLYTCVTRAKKCVTIVGQSGTIQNMINNCDEQKRYSGLAERINELYSGEDVEL